MSRRDLVPGSMWVDQMGDSTLEIDFAGPDSWLGLSVALNGSIVRRCGNIITPTDVCMHVRTHGTDRGSMWQSQWSSRRKTSSSLTSRSRTAASFQYIFKPPPANPAQCYFFYEPRALPTLIIISVNNAVSFQQIFNRL